MARDYELGIVINPEVGDDQARAISERVTTIITNNGGQVVRVNAWGRRRLAYPIQHFRDGLYYFYDLILDPTTIAEIERNIRLNEGIIRHLVKLRDPRVVAQQRQRDIELDTQREAEAQAQAAAAEAAAQFAQSAAASEPSEPSEPSEANAAPAASEASTVIAAEAAVEEPAVTTPAPATSSDEPEADTTPEA